MEPTPLVSAVIPTRNRPALVKRAVESVQGQTYDNLEIVVVIDGPDEETYRTLKGIEDDRLRIVALEENVGGSEARNAGMRAAQGQWIALLDDDDEWVPEKIEKQLRMALQMHSDYVVVGSRFAMGKADSPVILPFSISETPQSFQPGEYSEHLFCPKGLTNGGGYIQTSTWFISKPLVDKVPFTRGLKRNQDVDWLLRAVATPETLYYVLPDVLVKFSFDAGEQRLSVKKDWKFHLQWAQSRREYFSPLAFSYFLATVCAIDARRQKERLRGGLAIWRAIRASGKIAAGPLVTLLYRLLISEEMHAQIRKLIRGTRPKAMEKNLSLSSITQ